MYSIYTRDQIDQDITHYLFKEGDIKLFGCNEGLFPKLLESELASKESEPYCWHFEILKKLNTFSKYANTNATIVINLKPKQNMENLSLYEVLDIWGYSHHDWTPILLRLNGLFVDSKPEIFNQKDFIRKNAEINGPIYEFLYLNGSIREGKLSGRWNAPPASPTNAALLWPETLKYFLQCISDCTPDVFD